MITTIFTFLTEKIVAVVITIVIVVAAVPTIIVAINGNTITITPASVASTSRHHDEDESARLILEVKTAGEAVVVKIDNEEASCALQIDHLASQSKLGAAATRAAFDKGKGEFHTATLNFRKEIKDNEDELERLTVITTQTQQTFLVRISTVSATALGHDGHSGTLITVCQAILVEIRTIIVVVQAPSGGDEDDD